MITTAAALRDVKVQKHKVYNTMRIILIFNNDEYGDLARTYNQPKTAKGKDHLTKLLMKLLGTTEPAEVSDIVLSSPYILSEGVREVFSNKAFKLWLKESGNPLHPYNIVNIEILEDTKTSNINH